MNSSKLLTSIATPIIDSCDSISLVSFSVYKTHWYQHFGLMPNGKVEEFKCVGSFDDKPVPGYNSGWGFLCTP